jgi:ATP-dependent DNA helicase DinG
VQEAIRPRRVRSIPADPQKIAESALFLGGVAGSGEQPFAWLGCSPVHDAFAPGGALAETLPGFEPRPEQAALAAAVEAALASGEHLVAEAGTGTGKSLAYLLPALESGRRVVVATATKALQSQLLSKDVPAAALALGREVSVAVLKGRQNYVCRKQLASFGPMLLRDPRDEAGWDALQPWLAETETGDRAELPFEPSEALWAELAVGPDRCAGRRCPYVSTCFSEAARVRAGEAELVIANHALYFADVAAGFGVLPEHDAVVFDEAHRLEETAATWLGGRVSRASLRRFAADIERACRDGAVAVPARALDRVEQAGERLLRAVAPAAGRQRLRAIPVETALVLVDALAALSDQLSGRAEGLDQLARRALLIAAQVEACLEPGGLERVVWAEPEAIAWAPVDVATELRERLWDEGPTAILVSATLTTGDDARFVRRRLGLDHARELVVGSPYDFREQALLYVPRTMPDPRGPGFSESVAEEVVALLGLSRGRALVLTSSYRALEVIRERLAGRVPYAVLVQGEQPREQLLDRFRSEVDSVLLATSTFWQGVDIPGESLSLLVIDKLPFSAPGDPLHEARCEAVEAAGGDWFREYALPIAMLQLRQGFGRLIRSHDDCGVVAILDPRLRTKPYGRAFLGALPRAPMVDDRQAVAAFFGAPALQTA